MECTVYPWAIEARAYERRRAIQYYLFVFKKILRRARNNVEPELEYCSIGHVFDSHLVLGLGRTSSSEVERWIAVQLLSHVHSRFVLSRVLFTTKGD
jgi:hypothetical protein